MLKEETRGAVVSGGGEKAAELGKRVSGASGAARWPGAVGPRGPKCEMAGAAGPRGPKCEMAGAVGPRGPMCVRACVYFGWLVFFLGGGAAATVGVTVN